MSDELKRAAVAYAERGWRVFPVAWVGDDGACSCGAADCKSPAKHPLTAHGLNDASSDPQQAERWWREKPRANIGIRTGAESGLVLLDVDPPEGMEQLARIEAYHGPIPPTLTARSGKGGLHFYFAHPGRSVSNRQDVLGERTSKEMGAIDVRGDGGYIIAPPSRNTAGAYEWTAPEETPPAQIPDYLFPVLENHSDLRKRKKDERQAEEPRANEGTKGAHDTARDLAWTLVLGKMRDFAEIARYVDAVNAQQAQHGARRLTPNEISSLVAGALAKLKGETEPPVATIREKLAAKWKTLGELDWLGTEPPKRECLFAFPTTGNNQEDAIPLGRVGLFTGGGGQGKSWLLTQLAVSIASGSVWLDTYTPTKAGRVLLVFAEEDADEMHRRVKWAAEGLGDEAKKKLQANLVPLPLMGGDVPPALTRTDPVSHQTTETAFAEVLREKLHEEEWRLVVLDPLARFAGPEVEVDNAAATRFVETLETLTRGRGTPALVMSHHTTKASRSASGDETAARGASALVDGARWVAHVEAATKGDSSATSKRKKIHSFAVFKFTKVNYGVWPEELTLKRGEHGVLHLADDAEEAELERLKKGESKPTDAATGDEPPKRKPKGKRDRRAATAGDDAAEKMGLT